MYPAPGWVCDLVFRGPDEVLLATLFGVHRLDLLNGTLRPVASEERIWGLTVAGDAIRFVTPGHAHDVQGERSALSILPRDSYSAAAFSADGAHLALAGGHTDRDAGGVVHWLALHDADTGRHVRTLYRELDRRGAQVLRFDPSGDRLYECTSNDVFVWPRDSGEPRALGLSHAAVGAAAFHPDGRRVATCDYNDGQLKVADLESGRVLSACDHPHRETVAIEWVSDETLLVSSAREVWAYDRTKGPSHRVLTAGSEVTVIAPRPGTGTFLVATRSTEILECTAARAEGSVGVVR